MPVKGLKRLAKLCRSLTKCQRDAILSCVMFNNFIFIVRKFHIEVRAHHRKVNYKNIKITINFNYINYLQ